MSLYRIAEKRYNLKWLYGQIATEEKREDADL